MKRWIAATAAFVQHLKTTSGRTSLARCLRPDIEKKLHGEIDGILPLLEAVQDPKKDGILEAVNALRVFAGRVAHVPRDGLLRGGREWSDGDAMGQQSRANLD